MKSASLRLMVVAMLIGVAVVGGHLLPGLDATEIDREIRNGLHFIGFALIAAVIFEALSMRPLSAVVTTLLLVASLGGWQNSCRVSMAKDMIWPTCTGMSLVPRLICVRGLCGTGPMQKHARLLPDSQRERYR